MKRLCVVLLFVGSACSDDDSTAAGTCASVCGRAAYQCDVGGIAAPVAIAGPESFGCSGTIGPPETRPIWLHCDTDQVCVEHETECMPAHWLANGFSYEISGPPSRTVTCTIP